MLVAKGFLLGLRSVLMLGYPADLDYRLKSAHIGLSNDWRNVGQALFNASQKMDVNNDATHFSNREDEEKPPLN